MSNKYAGVCKACEKPVPANYGSVILYDDTNQQVDVFAGPAVLATMFPLPSGWSMELWDSNTSLGMLTEAQVMRWSRGGPIQTPEDYNHFWRMINPENARRV